MTYDNHPDGGAPHRRSRPDAAQRPGQSRHASDDVYVHPTRAARLAAQTNEGVGRAYGLTALGTLLPGAGLIATRRRLIGVPLLLIALGSGAVGLYYLIKHGAFRSALDLAARPDLLRVFAVLLAVGGLVWISSVVLTALTARPRRMTGGQRVGLTAFTGLMCLLIAAPTALGLRYIDAHNDAVETIFTGADDRPPNEGTPSVGPAVGESDPWADFPRVNVLLLGSDAADEREGVRTDSMMVASIDTTTGDMVLFGIPRNLQKVPIPTNSPLYKRFGNSFDCGNECLMNAIWTAAEDLHEENPGWFAGDPNPGQTATRQVISTILGQPVHYTVIIDLDGFEALVDAMGGVDINVQERVPIGGRAYTDANGGIHLVEGSERGWIELGPQHLDGEQALWYSRSRVTSDDFSRMRRQRCVVGALVDQVNPLTLLQRYPAIAAAAGDHITADIDQTELPAWAELVERVQGGTMRSLPFTAKNTNTVDPDYTAIRREVYLALHPDPKPDVEIPGADDSDTTASPTTEEPTTEEPTGTDEPTTDAPEVTTPETDELAELGTVC